MRQEDLKIFAWIILHNKINYTYILSRKHQDRLLENYLQYLRLAATTITSMLQQGVQNIAKYNARKYNTVQFELNIT